MPKGLADEVFNELLLLMVFAMVGFLTLSTKVDYQLDKCQLYYYAVIKKFVVAKCKYERPGQICRLD